jgi:hypothetical protein
MILRSPIAVEQENMRSFLSLLVVHRHQLAGHRANRHLVRKSPVISTHTDGRRIFKHALHWPSNALHALHAGDGRPVCHP